MSGERPYRGLLGRLSGPTARVLLDSGRSATYEPGHVLLRRGEDGGHAVLLLTGAVKVRADDSAPALLGVRSAGDLIGEMAVLDRRPRSATVVACSRVTARVISRYQLQVLLNDHHELLVELARANTDEIRWSNELRRAMPNAAAVRIAQVLLHLVHHHGHRGSDGTWALDVPLTNVELASIAGMKPRTAEKGFGELRDARFVLSRARRAIAIPDLDRLQQLTAGHLDLDVAAR